MEKILILNAPENTIATEAKQDDIISNQTNGEQQSKILSSDSSLFDAFGRMRVSNPKTIFDSKNIFNDPDIDSDAENQPLFYDNKETSGTGTSTSYDVDKSWTVLSVGEETAGIRVRQTKRRFNYLPGKSQLYLHTMVLGNNVSGITKRNGLFDNNGGMFIEASDDYYVVIRSKTSGSVVDTKISRENWNDPMDGNGKSGINVDFTKTQILVIDFQWLAVGRVRFGLNINGILYYFHEFLHANELDVVYTQTPNLPIRTEISNDGTAAVDSIKEICSSIISEGGQEETGVIRYLSTGGTPIQANTSGTVYVVCGIRLKQNYLGSTVTISNISMINATADDFEWLLIMNPTIANEITFSDNPNSAIQFGSGNSGSPSNSTVTGGTVIGGGMVKSGGGSGTVNENIENALILGSSIDGTSDRIYLCVNPHTNGADINGSITLRELS